MNSKDWYDASELDMQPIIQEYNSRRKEALLVAQDYTAEQIQTFYYATPVVMERKRHVYKLAMTFRAAIENGQREEALV